MPGPPDITIRDQRGFNTAIVEARRRKGEALKLYRPMPNQLAFHLSEATERVVRGGNRSGKTAAAAAEVASAALGVPLTGPDGKELPFRYSSSEPLVIWVIGYDEKHIARIYRKLFKRGLFQVIEDEHTGELRAWRPWEAADLRRKAETKPSPPLIPERLVRSDDCAWENKKEQVFSVIRLKNGTEIFAFPSGGEAGQGDAVDVVWIDEDIKIARHVDEWQARLADRDGRLIWSAWPHSANLALVAMSKRAKKETDSEAPDVSEVVLRFSDNPYIPAEAKRKRLKAWHDAGYVVARSRDEGEFTTDSILVFPTFSTDVHCLPSRSEPDVLERFLADRNWQVPVDWTNYLVLDPGHSHPAVLFASVPPPDPFGDHVVVWDEVYIEQHGPPETAAEVAQRMVGRYFETFLIDAHAGRQTGMGHSVGETVKSLYVEAFTQHGISSRNTGHSFTDGSDNVAARNMIVRQWLGPGVNDAKPKLRLIANTTPYTQREFGLYKKHVAREDVQEKVVDKDNHAMDALAYLAAFNPQYVKPEEGADTYNPVLRAWRAMRKRRGPKEDYCWMGAGENPERNPESLIST
jgi:hypothetical protein